MIEFIGKKGIYDGTLVELSEIKKFRSEDFSVYEIVRVEQEVALFLEDHFARLFRSLALEELKIKESADYLKSKVYELIRANEIKKGKIKFVFYFPEYPKFEYYHFLIYFTEAFFPSEEQYASGVDVAFCNAVRNDPNAKVLNTEARKTANRKITEKNVFEVFLVDNEGYIREGSRSNVFFISGNTLITPPDEAVLQGIARKKVLEICRQNDIPVNIRKVHRSELQQMQSIFLTGTSLKILPARKAEHCQFDVSSDLLKFLYEQYDQKIKENIRRRKEKQ